MNVCYVRKHEFQGYHYMNYSTIWVPENQIAAFRKAWAAEYTMWLE